MHSGKPAWWSFSGGLLSGIPCSRGYDVTYSTRVRTRMRRVRGQDLWSGLSNSSERELSRSVACYDNKLYARPTVFQYIQ